MAAKSAGPVFKRVAEQVLAYLATCRTMCRRHPTWKRRRTAQAGCREASGPEQRKMRRKARFQAAVATTKQPSAAATDSGVWRPDVQSWSRASRANRARRHRGVLAAWTDAVADWQRRCTGTVSGGRDAGACGQPRDGAIWTARGVGADVGARGRELSLTGSVRPKFGWLEEDERAETEITHMNLET